MSKVTDIVILTSLDENEDGVNHLNDYLESGVLSPRVGRALKQISTHAGGDKTFCGRLYAASINYLDVSAFIEKACGAPWVMPQAVQFLVQCEADGCFHRVYLVSGKRL